MWFLLRVIWLGLCFLLFGEVFVGVWFLSRRSVFIWSLRRWMRWGLWRRLNWYFWVCREMGCVFWRVVWLIGVVFLSVMVRFVLCLVCWGLSWSSFSRVFWWIIFSVRLVSGLFLLLVVVFRSLGYCVSVFRVFIFSLVLWCLKVLVLFWFLVWVYCGSLVCSFVGRLCFCWL